MLTLQPEVEERIGAAKMISLFLDFDGTLVPFAADPEAAWLDAPAREVLTRLAHKDSVVVTVISGRALEDLRMRAGVPGIIYAGNHGLEIRGRKLDFVDPIADARRPELGLLAVRLAFELRSIPGVSVEHKGLTVSVHHRRAPDREVPRIERAVSDAVVPLVKAFRLNPGKMILDIVPQTHWNKGSAVRWINAHLGSKDPLCIYFGDDRTDENVFGAMPEALTFKVGVGETRAQYRVNGPAEVHAFLRRLAMTR